MRRLWSGDPAFWQRDIEVRVEESEGDMAEALAV
jgi:hypothetical protein